MSRSVRGFAVMERQCATCIYRKDSTLDLRALEAAIADKRMPGFFAGFRVCHHHKTACCRGFWNRHKDRFTLGQLAQRLNFVRSVRQGDHAMKAQWEHVAFVESDSEPGVEHEVKRRLSDGHLGCACKRYRFAKASAKTCHHIETVLATAASSRYLAPADVAAPVRVTRGAETFTVTRRAVALGALPF